MITLYRGGAKNDVTEADIVVASQGEYVEARQAIRDALLSENDLGIHIIEPVYQNWFWDLQDHPLVEEINRDPRTRLENHLDCPLPAMITSGIIDELQLLDEPEPDYQITDPILWIAERKLESVWHEESSGRKHLMALIEWFILWGSSTRSSGLWLVIDNRLKTWKQQSTGAVQELYMSIRLWPKECIRFLCAWDALASYPKELRKEWLDEIGWYDAKFEGVADVLKDLLPHPKVDEGLKRFVAPYWGRRLNDRFKKEIHDSQ